MSTINPSLQKFYQKIWPDISIEMLETISEKYTTHSYKRGDVILKPGDVCEWTGLVNEGIVRYYHVVDGKEHVGQFFMPGMIVSDYVSYIEGSAARIYIDAVKDCEISIMRKEDSECLRQLIPGYLEMILKYLNLIYISNFERYSSLLLDPAETRYLKLLKSRPEIVQQVPLYMVASFLGITPEMLSRVRKKISVQGH